MAIFHSKLLNLQRVWSPGKLRGLQIWWLSTSHSPNFAWNSPRFGVNFIMFLGPLEWSWLGMCAMVKSYLRCTDKIFSPRIYQNSPSHWNIVGESWYLFIYSPSKCAQSWIYTSENWDRMGYHGRYNQCQKTRSIVPRWASLSFSFSHYSPVNWHDHPTRWILDAFHEKLFIYFSWSNVNLPEGNPMKSHAILRIAMK